MIFLTNPDHFSLILTDPDTSTIWPIWSNTWRGQMVIGSHIIKEEMLFNKFISLCLINVIFMSWSKTVIFAWKSKFIENLYHCVFKLFSFLFIHFRRKVPSLYISSDSCSHRNFFKFRINICKQILSNWNVPIVLLLYVFCNTMVCSNEWL